MYSPLLQYCIACTASLGFSGLTDTISLLHINGSLCANLLPMSQDFSSRPGIAWHEDIALSASGIPSSSLDSLYRSFYGAFYTHFSLDIVFLSAVCQSSSSFTHFSHITVVLDTVHTAGSKLCSFGPARMGGVWFLLHCNCHFAIRSTSHILCFRAVGVCTSALAMDCMGAAQYERFPGQVLRPLS